MRAAPVALTGLLGLILLEILKVVAMPLAIWLLGVLLIGFKIMLVVCVLIVAFFVIQRAARSGKFSDE